MASKNRKIKDALKHAPEKDEGQSAGIETPEEKDNPAVPPEEEEDNSTESAAIQTGSNSRLREMMDRNFIEYASYVIKDRAIPDVDDGLKPVQRRILWTLFEKDDGTFHKVANIIGETMKYHPHGDASIGDALVYLANKETYIDKQGNFGNIMTGSPAAAPRYIECRLTPLAREVLFNRDITELVDSYDGRNREPVRLPSKIPTLLLMGTDGIAVGTNTKVMSHNFNELLRAQIAILKDEPFTLYPDFLQGGIMDVSKYEDGFGRIVVRAKIELDGRNLVIREIPSATNTSKLMDTIEAAVNRNKIKIASFKDYTAEKIDIQLTPLRGYDPEKALNALYAYTNCQMSISCNPMVIVENRPRTMGVSAILRRNTEKLLEHLKYELYIESGKCLDKILARTLVQIFIEEGIYKRIEKCKTRDAMFSEVRNGLEKFKSEWLPIVQMLHDNILNGPHIMPLPKEFEARVEQLSRGEIPEMEIERLLEIPIRRISAFECNENRQQIELLNKTLNEAQKNLKRIKAYAIKYLQGLIDKYGALFPRRTEIVLDGFGKIDKSAVALNNIRVGWDKSGCYIGTNVKSDDVVVCNEFDHLLCIERKGGYKVIDIPEKIFIDRLYEFRKYDKTVVFGVVYSDVKTGKVYAKRCSIDKFIKDKEYRICPDGCRLELITPRANALYECRIDTPIRARQTQTVNLADMPVRSPRAGGMLLFARKLLKINFIKYLDGTEENEEPPLIDVSAEAGNDPEKAFSVESVPPEENAGETPVETAESGTEKKIPAEKEKAVRPGKKSVSVPPPSPPPPPGDKPGTKKNKKAPSAESPKHEGDSVSPDPEKEDENWGISQPELGF
ncbi:MAG: DNA gyrase subunit A [Lentisphaerae bacterium ADurb.Bin242]|nr:MAG: DNA gyrase subunit A [Lentisphaerae bacterium ADurb.Bin242]